jgi:hypothetical protein
MLDNGPDTVVVHVEVETTDDYGNRIMAPEVSTTTVRGRWQPSSAEESADLGQQTNTVYRFLCRDFPGGPYASVEYDGIQWDVIAEPRRHRGSSTTRHVTVYLKERHGVPAA